MLRHWRNAIWPYTMDLPDGIGIGTLVFHELAGEASYDSKYQNAAFRPQAAL
jgi:hypothetical protein